MKIRNISMSLAAVALVGTTAVRAAAPVSPSVAQLRLAPAYDTNLPVGARLGASRSNRHSDIGGSAAIVGILAAAAIVGGVVAATDNGNGHSASP